jgi:hypothetical protein
MVDRRHLPEMSFIKTTTSWRFWALGFHTYRRSRYEILCIGLGPIRLHFVKWHSRNG